MVTYHKGFIGKPQERAMFMGKVMNFKKVNTHYGERYIYNFITKSGKFGAFFIEPAVEGLSEGVCFHFTGTVKRQHWNEYSKREETMFNRVKIDKIFSITEENA